MVDSKSLSKLKCGEPSAAGSMIGAARATGGIMQKVVGWTLLLLICALPVTGQEVRGNISGTVRDSGGVLPGAAVEITNTDTNTTHRLTTNETGYFEAPLLQPGNYRVSVELQ